MSEKRFIFATNEKWFLFDNVTEDYLDMEDCRDKLNEQQDIIITLKRRLEKINGGYGNLTHYKGLTANEWLIQGQERELKKKDKQISEWIEQHSKDIVKISEQQATINELQDTVYDELDKALKVLEEIYEDYPKNNVHILYNNLKGLKEMME